MRAIYKVLRREGSDYGTLYYLFRGLGLTLDDQDYMPRTIARDVPPRQRSNIKDQPRTALMMGREEELTRLEEMFFPDGAFAEGKKVAITGVGGMGKTTVALEYANRQAGRYPYCFYCLANSQTNLTNAFLGMAELLKEEDPEIKRFVEADRNAKEYIPNVLLTVRNWLQRHIDYLLILDNADLIPSEVRERLGDQEMDLEEAEWRAGRDLVTAEEVEAFLPQPPYLRGHLLITSRNAVISEIFGIVTSLELKEMLPGAAQAFLLKRTNRGEKSSLPVEEQTALEKLVGGLHGLPLALEQAGAYIAELQQMFSTYLGIYEEMPTDLLEGLETGEETASAEEKQLLRQEEHRVDVLDRHKPVMGKYASTVAKTWLISFGAVKAESPAAAEAFTLAAFLDPDAAPMELLKGAADVLQEGGTPALGNLNDFFQGANSETEIIDRYDNLLQPLTRYSLVKKNAQPVQTFKIHRLVQAVRRRTLTASAWQFYYDINIEAVMNAFV